MQLPDDSIREFKDIWEKEFGVRLSDEKARKYGEELVSFYKLLIEIDRGKA